MLKKLLTYFEMLIVPHALQCLDGWNPGRFGPIPVRSGRFGPGRFGPISGVSRFGPTGAGRFGPVSKVGRFDPI